MNLLTEVQARKARPLEGSYKISDGGGMYLLVHHNGSKYWRINNRIGGQQRNQVQRSLFLRQLKLRSLRIANFGMVE